MSLETLPPHVADLRSVTAIRAVKRRLMEHAHCIEPPPATGILTYMDMETRQVLTVTFMSEVTHFFSRPDSGDRTGPDNGGIHRAGSTKEKRIRLTLVCCPATIES
jgi:hypothetical protein